MVEFQIQLYIFLFILCSNMGQCLSASQHVPAEHTATESTNDANKPIEATTGVQPATTTTNGGSKPSISSSGSGTSPVYSSLPAGAEKVKVRNVYDGDTLTLTDERRVRFLGIDTPEIKEKQPYAQEAKSYTKERCDKKDIWISFEPGQAKKDHYGRLLAFVWVKQGSGYLCVNEGIVAAGFATAYTPHKDSQLHNWEKFVKLQNEARSASRGMWSTFEDTTVVKTANGSAYHQRSCKHLAEIRNLTELKASQASAQGLHPCRTCFAG
jgi:micrococcal nuclease